MGRRKKTPAAYTRKNKIFSLTEERKTMAESIGIFIWFIILIIWNKVSIGISARIRWMCGAMVVTIDMILAIYLAKVWKLILGFALFISGIYCFAERFPKSGRRGLEITQLRRMKISFVEDYLFVIGITMLGIEILFFSWIP